MSADKQDFKPVKVKIKSSKDKSNKYISGDLLYSGVNLFGKLSEIYLEKIKNGELFTSTGSSDLSHREAPSQPSQDYTTPQMAKKGSNVSTTSTASFNTQSVLQNSAVFQMDQEVMSLFRKLQKKDGITKVKALRALYMYVQKVNEEEAPGFDYAEPGSQLSQVLTFFLYHFERIITYEIEKSVREAAHDVLGEFLITCKKNFAQHIINLFPLWYISFYDSAPEIRTKARNNFMTTFKTPEIRSALFKKSVENQGSLKGGEDITIAQNFLYFIQEKITHFEMLLSEDMTTLDKPQRDSIFDRIISGCLEALSDSFETFAVLKEDQNEKSWTEENTEEYIDQIIDVFGLNSKDFPTIYKYLTAKFNSPIRGAALRLVEKMSSYMVGANPKNKEVFTIHIHKLSNSMFSAIADESSYVQRMLWKSVLFNVCTLFKEDIWQQVDIKKGVLPQLQTCLKNAGFGAHTDLYRNFVAFVSIMPIFDYKEPLETVCKVEQSGSQKQKPVEEDKHEEEDIDTSKKSKKKQKKGKDKSAVNTEGGGQKSIKNSFSISEKINITYEVMKSLFSGLDVEEAVAFNEEVINSYYETMSYLYLKRIIPAMEHLESQKDEKNLESLRKKSVQCFMLPITEYLKKNDPKMARSLYNIIPVKFAQTLTLLASKGVGADKLEGLFEDINETLIIGLERAPHNAIKILSAFLTNIEPENTFYSRVQKIGSSLLQHLYKQIIEGVKSMSKDTLEKFEKDIEIFSYISHNLLTKELLSPIFELDESELSDGVAKPHEFTIMTNILEIVKVLKSKMKPEFLNTLEIIEEKMWLCLILRMNYLCKRGSEPAKKFMDGPMLDLIFDNIKSYEIDDDRYLRFVIQYISPADCLSLLVSENIEKKPDLRKFKKKVLESRNKELDELFTPYEDFMMNSQRVQDKCLKVLYIDMIDDYSKSHLIQTIYAIFQRKIEDYVAYKNYPNNHTIMTEDTVKSFLSSTVEFLEETEQVHKSYQLAELGKTLSMLILNTKRDESNFELCRQICRMFFTVLLDMQQNISSALDQWKFINKLLDNSQINHENEYLYFIEDILKHRIHNLVKLSNYQEFEFNNEILVLRNFTNAIPRINISVIESLSRIVLHEENFSMLSRN